MAQEYGLQLKYDTVNHFVREKLNAQLQVPRPQSLKQKPEAVSRFQQTFPWS